MFFQVNITPKEKKAKESISKKVTDNNYSLLLAPFQPPTRIKLETRINTSIGCKLHINNSNLQTLNVSVSKFIPEERRITLSDTAWTIEQQSSVILNILWEPQEGGTWRDVLQLSDNRHFKYDIPFILTCNDPNKKLKSKKEKRTVQKYPLSTKVNNAQNVQKKASLPKKTIQASSKLQSELKRSRSTFDDYKAGKENLSSNVNINWMLEQARIKKFKTEETSPAPADFSKLLNSSTFNFTPLKSQFTDFSSHPTQDYVDFSPTNETKKQSIPSIFEKNEEKVPLRKDTYVTIPKYLNMDSPIKACDNEIDFDDSLSPRTSLIESEKPQSEISKLFSDLKFTPFKPACAKDVNNHEKINFSPNNCSTERKSKRNQLSPDVLEIEVNKNLTFEIDNAQGNNTYELPKSPTSTKINYFKPTCLAKTFNHQSGIEHSFQINTSCNTANEYTRFSNQFSKSQIDFGSAKDCLEADLWVKSRNVSLSPISKNLMHSTLDSIVEEDVCCTNKRKQENFDFSLDIKQDKKQQAVCIEISPPKNTYIFKKPPLKRSPLKKSKIIKEKSTLDTINSKKMIQITKSIKNNKEIDIPGIRITRLSLKGLHKNENKSIEKSIQKPLKEVSVKLHDPNDFMTFICNPDPFAASIVHDPFLASTLYYDDKWVFVQESAFKKWLNALLTPPEHLTTDVETTTIDVAKVWQSCRAKEDVALAETKESVSARYHTNTRLNALRKAAVAMFHKQEVITALSQTTVGIEKEILIIRQDKDLHRDIGLQKIILELFISYNPLWLRIGLETIYGETIPLQSNNDIIGLSRFIINRFFSDPYLVKTHSVPAHPKIKLKTFQAAMNKFMLKKFLFLVYFLDYAKRNKLIGHDPCLFHKKASKKESKELLLTFSCQLLSGIGDITKVLRNYNYVVSYKQTYLDEYDYAVEHLSTDLRDGVKLCRVMELITGKKSLTNQCWVPAETLIRKNHNVNIALTTLIESGYTLTGDIDAKSIASGHREKTLSLLWQIIYKFQAPRFEKAAKTVQQWWRSKLWYVNLKNMLRNRKRDAASVIQRAWRCYLARKKLQVLKKEHVRQLQRKTEAAKIIQLHWRSKKAAKRQQFCYQHVRISVIKIQKWWKRLYSTKPYVNDFRRQQRLIIIVQRRWRATQLMKVQRNNFLQARARIVKLQNRWRARCLGKITFQDYQNQKKAIIYVQRKWRAKLLMKKEREIYFKKLNSIKIIQKWWKQCLVLKKDRNNYIALKNAVKIVEKVWIAKHFMPEERKLLFTCRSSAIIIQRTWRNYRSTKNDVSTYKHKKNCCIKIQSWWRTTLAMKRYNKQRSSCIQIQRWYRSIVVGRKERSYYLLLKNSVITVQKNRKMVLVRRDYIHKRNCCIKIQSWWRSNLAMNKYKKQQVSCIRIQTWYRSIIISRNERSHFLSLKKSAIVIQKTRKMILARRAYKHKRNCCIKIQSWWRSTLAMKKYKEQQSSCIQIQRWYRSIILSRKERSYFLSLKKSAITVQKTRKMIIAKREYSRKKNAVIQIEMWYKNIIYSRHVQKDYINIKNATNAIKTWWLALKIGKRERNQYLNARERIIFVQQKWRAQIAMKSVHKQYLLMKNSATKIQSWWKMILEKRRYNEYLRKVRATCIIQQRWRALKCGRKAREVYAKYRSSIIFMQRKRRAICLARFERSQFLIKRKSAVIIQKHWRRFIAVRRYEEMKRTLLITKIKRKLAVAKIENWWIKMLEIRRIREIEKAKLMREYQACIKIQAAWRGFKVRREASAQLAILREKAKNTAKTVVPSDTLASRLQENIEIFNNVSNIGQLSVCLSSLDVITRLSPNACIHVCQLNLVSKLYDILTQANRSLPWLDICLKDISILLTLAKFKQTREYVLKEEYIEILVRLLTISVDKKEDLFLHTATLLWVLTDDQEYAEVVKNCSRTKYLLSSLYTSIDKKLARNTQISKCKGETLPSPKPDWGLSYKRPRIFSNVLQAITSLTSRLNILNINHSFNAQRSFNFSM